MATQRSGTYGVYYGSLFTESESLTQSEMEINAQYIFSFFKNKGWSNNAIAGILGNMQAESSLNPGRWQSEDIGNTSGGYGLVQWTPASKYLEWVSGDASTMDNNLSRIIYEIENGLQWIPTDEYPLSFASFTTSTETPSYLASAFLKCYERAGVEVEATRQANANEWYAFLTGKTPSNPSGTKTKKKKGYKFVLFRKERFTRQ